MFRNRRSPNLTSLALGALLTLALCGIGCSDTTTLEPDPDQRVTDSSPADTSPDLSVDQGQDDDQGTPDQSPDQPMADLGVDQEVADQGADQDLTPDFSADLPTADTGPGPVQPDRCAGATLLTLVSGSITVSDDLTSYSNDYPRVECPDTWGTHTTLDGPQVYYKFQALQDQWYRFVLEPTVASTAEFYLVAFTSGCTAADIQGDCRSAGASGDATRHWARGETPRVLYYKAKSNGLVHLAVDTATKNPVDGGFRLSITALPPASNDTCASATALTLVNGAVSAMGDVHNLLTPDEYSSVSCGGHTMSGGQIYYKFDAVAGTDYRVSVTNNAGYHLSAYIFASSCADIDIPKGCTLVTHALHGGDTGEALFTPQTSGTYHVAVDGTENYSWGQFTLNVEKFVPPAHGACAAAKPLTLFNGKAVEQGSTLGTQNEFGTDIRCGQPGYLSFDGGQVYHKLSAKADKYYKLTYRPSFRSSLYIFRSASCGTVADMKADCASKGPNGMFGGEFSPKQTKSIVFRPRAAGDYTIALDGKAGTSGTYRLTVEEFDVPTNDSACGGAPLSFANGKASIKGSSTSAANEFGTTAVDGIDCGNSKAFAGPQVYYEFTVDGAKGYTLSLTPKFKSAYLYVFEKSACNARRTVDAYCGSNGIWGATSASISAGETATLAFNPLAPGQYVIAVDTSDAGGGGEFLLEVEEQVKPTNDTCANAKTLTLTNGTITEQSTTAFALDEYRNLTCADPWTSPLLDGPQLYWSLAMSATKNYAITATTTFADGYVYVFDGNHACSETAIEQDCASEGATGISKGAISKGSATAYFSPPSDGAYKIAIDSYDKAGDVTLKVLEFDSAANQTCATAKTLTLSGGEVVEDGYTVGTKNEFPGLVKCGQATALDGGQTYYKIALTQGQAYSISLHTDHSAALYVFDAASACTASAIDSACASGGAKGMFAQIVAVDGGSTGGVFTPAASGTFYVVVDTPAAVSRGAYTLKVQEVTANKGLVIEEFGIGRPDYIALRNNGSTSVSTLAYKMLFLRRYASVTNPSYSVGFPDVTLNPGQTAYFIATGWPLKPGEHALTSYLSPSASDNLLVMLCNGECAVDGSNVIDVLLAGDRTNIAIPSGIQFFGDVAKVTSDDNKTSYQRLSYVAGPPFLATDWHVAPSTRP